jgi:hypothetical protein
LLSFLFGDIQKLDFLNNYFYQCWVQECKQKKRTGWQKLDDL